MLAMQALQQPYFAFRALCLSSLLFALSACSPALNWRDFQPADGSYTVLMPGKPASHARPIQLNGSMVQMHMQAVDIDDTTYAVGSLTLADAGAAVSAIQTMKNTMVNNVQGTIALEKISVNAVDRSINLDVEINGTAPPNSNGQRLQRTLFLRFVAKGNRLYQILVAAPQIGSNKDTADQFITSFKAL